MSLILNTTLTGVAAGTSLNFKDVTGVYNALGNPGGYGSPNPDYSDVTAIRIKIGTADTLTATSQLIYGQNFAKFNEYFKVSGSSSTVQGKTMVVGSVFVPQFDSIAVPSGDVWQATGYFNTYLPPATYLPTSAQLPLILSLTNINQSTSTNVQDNLYNYTYEVYTTSSTPTFAAVSGTTYIVAGTQSSSTNYVTYNGSTYYVGEVFTAIDTSNVTKTGTATCSALNSSNTAYAFLLYQVETDMNNIILGLVNRTIDMNITQQITSIRTYIDSMKQVCNAGNVPYSQGQQMLIFVQDQISELQLLLN